MLGKIKEYLFGPGSKKTNASATEDRNQTRRIVRDGELTSADDGFDAWTTRDLQKMRTALENKLFWLIATSCL